MKKEKRRGFFREMGFEIITEIIARLVVGMIYFFVRAIKNIS
ncbi:hypothetical protein [Staphylococcus croceilyticus]|nr:hypothetical protein [Staphylococcus croceilyticus]